MKKIVSVLCVVVLLTLVVPVAAQTAHECPHEGNSILNLRNCVEHAANMGHIDNKGVAQGLLSKLDDAKTSLDAGQIKDAVGSLNAFINLVKAQSGKHIDATHADHMIHHAVAVIAGIGG